MKLFFATTVFILLCAFVNAQRICGTTAYIQQSLNNNPALQNRYNEAEAQITAATIKAQSFGLRDTGANEIIYIPVVVHVLYNTNDQNISVEQVLSQIKVLNDDYSRQNGDRVNTPAVFAKVAADARIRFCLAQVDAKGRRTSGIIKKFTSKSYFTSDDGMKFNGQGGDDAWDAGRYLNLWVCNMGGRTLGYATFPGGPANADGVVIANDVFGTVGNLRPKFNKGRTATHEVGHWLGLKHIWGDVACGTDDVDDTPKQQYYNYGCPAFPSVSNCSPDANGDMFMNYMDFSDDACMNIFTIGQKMRMRALFAKNNLRNSFLVSFACDSTLAQAGPLPATDTVAATTPKQPALYKIYPNPAQSVVTIACTNATVPATTNISIFNSLGNKVVSTQLNSEKMAINIVSLTKGIYFIRIDDGKNKVTTKLIKE